MSLSSEMSPCIHTMSRLVLKRRDYAVIRDHVFKKLQSSKDKWRKIMKALQLTEYMVNDGNARFIKDLHKNIFLVTCLDSFNHFVDNSDKGKPIRSLAARVTNTVNEKMKNIESLMSKTEEKFKHGVPREEEEFEENEAEVRFRKERMRQVEKLNEKERHENERLRQSQVQKDSIVRSQIDPNLYKNPNADKEILSLVDSQFGKGFLEFDFGENDASKQKSSHHVPKKRPIEEKEYHRNYEEKKIPHVKGSDTNYHQLNDFDDFRNDFSNQGGNLNRGPQQGFGSVGNARSKEAAFFNDDNYSSVPKGQKNQNFSYSQQQPAGADSFQAFNSFNSHAANTHQQFDFGGGVGANQFEFYGGMNAQPQQHGQQRPSGNTQFDNAQDFFSAPSQSYQQPKQNFQQQPHYQPPPPFQPFGQTQQPSSFQQPNPYQQPAPLQQPIAQQKPPAKKTEFQEMNLLDLEVPTGPIQAKPAQSSLL